MTTKIRIPAAASAFISLAFLLAIALSPILAANERDDGILWAIKNREEAFNRLMPRVARFSSNQSETAFSVRAAGFEDHFEFLLTIEQHRGRVPEAILVIPDKEPLVVQLARMRADKSLSLDDMLPKVRITRRQLPPQAARRLYDRLVSVQLPLRPQTGFFLHRQHLEVTAVGWNELQFDFFDDGNKSSPFGRILIAVWSALRDVGVDRSELAFDPAAYHAGNDH
jgi:hypothetical protein